MKFIIFCFLSVFMSCALANSIGYYHINDGEHLINKATPFIAKEYFIPGGKGYIYDLKHIKCYIENEGLRMTIQRNDDPHKFLNFGQHLDTLMYFPMRTNIEKITIASTSMPDDSNKFITCESY